jgi:hypothetical protein
METIARLAVLLSIATGFLAGMVAAPTDARAPTTIGARAPMTIGGLDISCGRAEPSRSSAGSWRSAPWWWRSRAACAWTRIAEAHAR